jgi:hypothetical protein
MPLIECPVCYKDVSDKAAACPNCGHPIGGYDPTAAERARRLLASQSTEDDVENGNKHGGRGFFMFVMLIAVGPS